jgi:APA family basic amino acid/polyamine antiporter
MKLQSLFLKKNVKDLIASSSTGVETPRLGGQLKRSLGAFNLTMIGIGAVIGAGIFSITGTAAAYYAGPGIVYSFIIGGILSTFAGLCYAELASMIPVAGSAYTYSYATLGELIAWIIGWDLILEYAFGAVAIANAWSGYLVSLVSKTLGITLSDTALRLCHGAWEIVRLNDGSETSGIWNMPASLIVLCLSSIIYKGIKESARLNNIIVLVKVVIILTFIALGWSVVDPQLWFANANGTGLQRLVPEVATILKNGKDYLTYGWSGVLTGAGVVFFAYIGFDMISTTAQECKNPAKDLPIGILVSLVVCTILYVLVSLVMTGVIPYQHLAVSDPVALGVDRIVELRGWSVGTQKIITATVKLGAIAGLTSGLLVCLLGQSRIFFAVARDGLLPWFERIHPGHGTPHLATIVSALFVAILAGILPMSLVGELVSIGTLLAFIIVCISIPILRWKHPHVPRPFKVPFAGAVSLAGTVSCLWVMSGLPSDTWIRLIVWLAIGLVIYFTYGIKHSHLQQKSQ